MNAPLQAGNPRAWLIVGAIGLAMATFGVIGMVIYLTEGYARLIGAGAMTTYFAGVGLSGFMIRRKGTGRELTYVASVAAGAGLFVGLCLVMGMFDRVHVDRFFQAVLLAVACGIVSLISTIAAAVFQLVIKNPIIRVVRTAAIVGLSVAASFLWMVALLETNNIRLLGIDYLMFLAVGMIFLSLISSAVMPVISRHDDARRRERDSQVARATMELSCPACRAALKIKPGRSWCETCGSELELEIEEPRCVCGYLIFRLTGTSCPECGLEIPEALRPAVIEKG